MLLWDCHRHLALHRKTSVFPVEITELPNRQQLFEQLILFQRKLNLKLILFILFFPPPPLEKSERERSQADLENPVQLRMVLNAEIIEMHHS